jgi:LemA protein
MTALAIVIGLVFLGLIIIGFVIMTYNSLVGKQVETKNAWSQIDVQLKRRYDLIPNLVETVKGYAKHEQETLEKVIQARNMAMGAQTMGERSAAENQLTGALKTLFAVSEAYPELKANEGFLKLQEELTATENRISFARQHYNDVVSDYNVTLMRFPANVVAGSLGFRPAEFFALDPAEAEAARKAPQVKF